MLATEGFENKHKVKIYENEVIINASEIALLEKMNDPNQPVPEPQLRKINYIEAKIPQARSGYNGPLTDKHKETFPKMWEAFLNKQSRLEEHGVSIDEMPEISIGVKEKLKSLGIVSIDALADIDDVTAGRIPSGLKMREKAKKVLEAMKDDVVSKSTQKLSAMEAKVQEMSEKMQEMADQNMQLAQIIQEQQEKKGKQKKAS